MSRYIDADAMLEYLELAYDNHSNMDTLYNTGVLVAINYIKHKADTIDIVRCEECKNWKWIEWAKEYRCILRNTAFNARANDFCSYGEREGE